MTFVFIVEGAYQEFQEDDANEHVKLIIQTIKGVGVNPYSASNDVIRICVDVMFREERWSDSQIQNVCDEVRAYIDFKATKVFH